MLERDGKATVLNPDPFGDRDMPLVPDWAAPCCLDSACISRVPGWPDDGRDHPEFSQALTGQKKVIAMHDPKPLPTMPLNGQPLLCTQPESGELQATLDEHVLMAVTDRFGRITQVNSAFCTSSQYSREELLGKDHRIISLAYHSKEFINHFWHTLVKGHLWHGEIMHQAKDRSFYWLATTVVPLPDAKGYPGQLFAIQNDITERKTDEHTMRNSEPTRRSVGETPASGW